MHITVNQSEINISGGTNTTGFSHVTEPVEKTGDDNRTSFNPDYILEFLKHAEGIVTINLSSENTLAKFSNDKGDYYYFLMPTQDKNKPGLYFQEQFTHSSEEWRSKTLNRDCEEAEIGGENRQRDQFDEALTENRSRDAAKAADPSLVLDRS